jgi:peptidoglycan/LPS O-acetylase OafA/YrhL
VENPLWHIEAVSLVSLAALAWLSWRFFEQPLLKLGRSVRYEPAVASDATLPVGSTSRP